MKDLKNEISILIELIAEELRKAFDVENERVFNISELVRDLEGSVRYEENVSGFAFVKKAENSSEKFNIVIDKYVEKNERTKRFTIAHELGHLFLHMGYLQQNSEKWQNITTGDAMGYGTDSIREKEANKFALSFLMPEKLFYDEAEKHKENDYIDINEMSKVFEVPVEWVDERGKDLDIWD